MAVAWSAAAWLLQVAQPTMGAGWRCAGDEQTGFLVVSSAWQGCSAHRGTARGDAVAAEWLEPFWAAAGFRKAVTWGWDGYSQCCVAVRRKLTIEEIAA